MELKGKVHEIGQIQNVTDTFKKRELVIEYAENPQYPEYVKFEAIQDKVSLIDLAKIGDEVEVNFNLKGRAWTDKEGKKQYFNSLHIWKLNVLTSAPQLNQPESATGEDDLPF